MAQIYAKVKGQDVYIMKRATKKYAPKGYVIVQSLRTGDTATIKRALVKKRKKTTTRRRKK